MQPNKFFNDSSKTAEGRPKFMPPQKRQGPNEGQDSAPSQRSEVRNENRFENNTSFRNQNQGGYQPQNQYQQQNQGQRSNYGNQNYNNNYSNNNYNNPNSYGSNYNNPQFKQFHNQQHHQSHSADPNQGHYNQSYNRDDNQGGRRNNQSAFGRNRTSCLSNWGYRHLRTGHVDKDVEEEELALFEAAKSSTSAQANNVNNYDHLKVDIINKFNLSVPSPQEQFSALNLTKCLLDNIERCGYEKLTIIQRHSIPIMIKRLNLMASSQTGSGKTASFLLPIIQDLLNTGPPKNDVSKEEYKKTRKCYPLALILAPTRELAIQIHEEAKKFCHLTGILAKVIYGGKDSYNQQRYLSWDGCDILVTTPGRLIDFMDRIVDFSYIRYIVLDEADRMLDMGFEPQIRQIMDRSFDTNCYGGDIMVAMFSATFPKEVRGLAERYLKSYVYVGIGNDGKSGTVSKTITQELVDARHKIKNQILFDHIKNLDGKMLIFCATKKAVASVYTYLNSKNIFVSNIHGDLSQKDREAELSLFKNKCSILIATDVASRGLDIPDVAFVINYDLPTNIESYIHRIGRTGRIGKTGTAISFVTDFDEPMFNKLYNVLKDSNQEIPDWFQEIVRSKYQREERQPTQNRSNKPFHHKWRGGYQGNQGNRGGYFGGGNRGYNRNDEEKGYDSDYSRPQTYGGGPTGGNRGYGRYENNFSYE